ncbi:hypothetical protein HORM4_950073 [Vibrio harveyi]|nr:hypothetical protein HORM4_950073 [Vibrio harveyi]
MSDLLCRRVLSRRLQGRTTFAFYSVCNLVCIGFSKLKT